MNHNCVSPPITSEIINNFLGNPIDADRTGKLYDRTMGSDMYLLLTSNEKNGYVGPCIFFIYNLLECVLELTAICHIIISFFESGSPGDFIIDLS